MHREPLPTHHISSNIIINQDKIWPFYIEDYTGKVNIVHLNKGDIILYEGAKRPHSRLEKFKGTYCDLIYLHYKLKGWEYIER